MDTPFFSVRLCYAFSLFSLIRQICKCLDTSRTTTTVMKTTALYQFINDKICVTKILQMLLTRKIANQGFHVMNLNSSLRTFYGRHHELVKRYGRFVSQMTTYVPIVETTITSPFPWLRNHQKRIITGFVHV